jgi:GT2 family glycosyltransferase
VTPPFRVAVVIPTCARPALLARALASVRAQESAPDEVLVVDDGERRDHETILRTVAEHMPAARVVPNAGAKGPSGARNTGAALATASAVAFLDDDDEWLPQWLGEAGRVFASGGVDVACADLVYRYADGMEQPGKTAPDALAVDAFLTRNPGLVGSNLIIRRSLYRALGGFDESLPTFEDMDFGIRLSLAAGVRYAPVHQRLVRHYQHSQPRLCTPRGDAMRAGVRRFFALHGARMSEAQRAGYGRAVRILWGVDEDGRDTAVGTTGVVATGGS